MGQILAMTPVTELSVVGGHPPQQLSVETEGRGDHEARQPQQPRHQQAAPATLYTGYKLWPPRRK